MTAILTTPEGQQYLTAHGVTHRVDAVPPVGHQRQSPATAGNAMAPCAACGKPLARIFAVPGHHLLCMPMPLRICGAGKLWTTLHVVDTATLVWQLHEVPGRPKEALLGQQGHLTRARRIRVHRDAA